MFDFMNTMKFISKSHLRTSIIYPLLKSGKLKKTCHDNKNQMYYENIVENKKNKQLEVND